MYFKTLLRLSICWAVLLVPLVAAMAEPITFGFTGIVTGVGGPLSEEFSFHELFVGSYTFETTTPDTETGDPSNGVYENVLTAFSVTIGGDYTLTLGPDSTIWLHDGPRGNDVYILNLDDPVGDSVAGYEPVYFYFDLIDMDATFLTSEAIPLTPPDLAQVDTQLASLGFRNEDTRTVAFQLLTLTLIPEPSTSTMLLCGLTSLLCWRRRK